MSKLNELGGRSGALPVLVKRTLIPAASVNLLNATAQVVVPDPGEKRALLFLRAIVNVCGGATDGNVDGDLLIRYQDGGTQVSCALDDFLNDASAAGYSNTIESLQGITNPQTTGTLTANKGLEIYCDADISSSVGDRNLMVTVFYQIVDLEGV